jgi:hypothetical protein
MTESCCLPESTRRIFGYQTLWAVEQLIVPTRGDVAKPHRRNSHICAIPDFSDTRYARDKTQT